MYSECLAMLSSVCLSGIVIMSAAVHRMHLEIVNGRNLYTECQHRQDLAHQADFSEISQVLISAAYIMFVFYIK